MNRSQCKQTENLCPRILTRPAPLIRRLTIERFRGIEKLDWFPEPGVNVILGGGDVGKTTILDAIALLLSPTNTTVLSEADYWRREVDEKGFCIEAVMSLPETCGINQQRETAPGLGNGTARKPNFQRSTMEPTVGNAVEPVYRLRVRGTAEFDLAFEVLQPDDTTDHLAVAVRRKIGLVRLVATIVTTGIFAFFRALPSTDFFPTRRYVLGWAKNLPRAMLKRSCKMKRRVNLKALETTFQRAGTSHWPRLGVDRRPGLVAQRPNRPHRNRKTT